MDFRKLRQGLGVPDYDFASFKDVMGRWRTRSLFSDVWVDEKINSEFPPVFSLDYFHDIYVQLEDPTGYTAAMVMLNSWEHWEKLCSLGWFKKHVDRWNEEIEVRMRARGINAMVSIAIEGGAKATTAAKWLAEGKWNPKARGAPSKQEIAKAARQLAEHDEDVKSALDRMGLNDEAASG